ncbi:hypothetical protein V1264_000697 [Littorina saxatilis]|uniref:MAM domain-containing protein n=2 Tax=Littorina saxatilis TaxID=31220 RepID=A0AAN9C0E3_9CAEN
MFLFDVDSETNSQLSVHLQHDNREKSEELLWSLFEVNKNNWDFGRAPLNSADKYRVVFSASSSKQVWIDDIQIRGQSDCIVKPPEARPATTRHKNTITYSTATGSTLQDQPPSSRWIVVGVVTVFAVTVSIAVAALVIVFRQRRRNRTPSAGQQPDQMVNRCELPTPNSDHKNEHKTQEGNGSMGLPARGTASASQRLSEQFERDDEGYEAPVSPLALNDYDRDPTFRRDHGPNVKDAAPMINRQMLEPSGSSDSAVAVDLGDSAQQSMRQEMETCSAATRRTGRYDCLVQPDAGTQSAQYGYTSLRGLAKHNLIVEEAADYITVVGERQSTVQQGCDVEYSLAKSITGDNEKPSEEEVNEYITLVDERDSQLYCTVTK